MSWVLTYSAFNLNVQTFGVFLNYLRYDKVIVTEGANLYNAEALVKAYIKLTTNNEYLRSREILRIRANFDEARKRI